MDYFKLFAENEYFIFIITLIFTTIIIGISYLIIKKIINKIAGRKKTYSKYLLKQMGMPIFVVIFLAGLYLSLQSLSIFEHYRQQLTDIFFIIITLLIAFIITRVSAISLGVFLKIRKGLERTPHLINNFFSIIIYLLAIIVILGYFKLDITPLIAGVGVGALAIGLALQSTLSNFFAGLHIVSDQPIRMGDFIELDKDTIGFVEDIGWRSTRIKTMTDNLLIVPNAKLADSTILNYSMPKQTMSLWVPCGVAYESDLQKVEEVTLEVAKEVQQTFPGAVKDFEPLFRFREFGDSNIDFIAILRVEQPMKRYVLRNEFIKKLKKRFDQENIEISWPIRKIYNIK
ncbi:MAG: mechanosensitive ion channel family protein [Candidatus Thermoplasmatota archaeon]|nr:mechanosensitive ion channel family protein [Candidatus Thermoplasmatota archaeon]MBS3802760.1 mechanosensitive ion channel family protein [Candidatus Thermoplasmatota archaeon]